MSGAPGIKAISCLEEILHTGFSIDTNDRGQPILQTNANAYRPLYGGAELKILDLHLKTIHETGQHGIQAAAFNPLCTDGSTLQQ